MDKCDHCRGHSTCVSKHTLSYNCKNMNQYRIWGKNFSDSRKILDTNEMEQKVRALHERYVDACTLCTKSKCNNCTLNDVIEDLEEILKKE